MTKEGITKFVNCTTLRVGVVVLGCGHCCDTVKEPQCRMPDTQVIVKSRGPLVLFCHAYLLL